MIVRMLFEGEVPGGGDALEIDHIIVFEVDADHRAVAIVLFEPADLDATYVEIDRRFEAGEAVACAASWAATRSVAAAMNAHDKVALLASFTSGYVGFDHRRLQWGSMLSDPAVFAQAADYFANKASTTDAPVIAAMVAHDWDRFAGQFSPDFHISDRRHVVQLEFERDQYVAFTRQICDGRTVRCTSELLATRGERLALVHNTGEFTDHDVGPSEVVSLILVEVNEAGRIVRYDRWDVDDLDAAYAELDARYLASEGERWAMVMRYQRALADRDWDTIAALYPPTFVEHDHRGIAVLGTMQGADAWIQHRALVELAPDTMVRFEHVRHSARGYLIHLLWYGSRDGADFEIPFLVVGERDENGVPKRHDLYEPEQIAEARKRFAEVGVAAMLPPFRSRGDAPDFPLPALMPPTTATAWVQRGWSAFETGDWDALRAGTATGFTWEDRRPMFRLSGDIELMIASARERIASGASHARRSIVGTAGDRIVLSSVLWAGGPDDGRFEVEFLALMECDENGRVAASVFFDPGDARAAQREAWARWARIDPAAAAVATATAGFVDAFNANDRATFAAFFARDLVVDDHRRTGMGRLEGADAYAASVATLLDLAEVSHIEDGWIWPAFDRHGAITVVRRSGTIRDGGEFEVEHLNLFTVAGGRITRMEFFELEDIDKAKARLIELRPERRPL
jgi:ketosteroid isomerase-like protein